jgi:hypothetical protein
VWFRIPTDCISGPDADLLRNANETGSVADLHHLDADPDPACHFDADPDPDPACQLKADPFTLMRMRIRIRNPDPSFQIKAQTPEKVLK